MKKPLMENNARTLNNPSLNGILQNQLSNPAARSGWSYFGVFGCIAILSVLFTAGTLASNNYAIVGDSLSKEYSVEGPVLWGDLLPLDYTDYTHAIKARNWMEILISRRGSEFNFGGYGTRFDSRVPAGHQHNWAVPGSTTAEWQGALNGSSMLDQFILNSFNSDIQHNVNRVVVFLGGNDLNNNYGTYYNGADPTAFIASLLDNYASIIQHIKATNSTAQIVICTAPDVGATPNVRNGHSDPVKRALVTSLTETLNAGIAQLATQQGLGLADISAFTSEYLSTGTMTIGWLPLIKGSNKGNYPTYLFSEDGFHPNTPGQALIANEIILAFNTTFQAGIAPLTDLEIINYLASQHDAKLEMPNPPLIPTPSGTFYHDFSGTVPVWDISGDYSGDIGQSIGLGFTLIDEPSGKFTGTGTVNTDDGAGNVMSGTARINGNVKSSGSATIVAMTFLTSGTGTVSVGLPASIHEMSFTGKIKLKGEIDRASGQLIVTGGSSNARKIDRTTLQVIKTSTKIEPGTSVALPAGVNGDWDMTLDLIANGTRYSGTATVQTLPGKATILAVSGGFSSATNTSSITLKDHGANFKMVVATSGSNMTIQSINGKLYGQALRVLPQ